LDEAILFISGKNVSGPDSAICKIRTKSQLVLVKFRCTWSKMWVCLWF